MGYVVIRPAVKVSIGAAGGNKVAQLLRRGDVVPEGVAVEQLADLVERGFLEVVAEAVEVEIPKATDPVAEIDDFAERFSIDISAAKNREEKVAEIERVIAERTAAAEASGTLQ